ncbi:hypothetical protein AZF04_08975 [Alkalihalobacillus trypoxylicola]|uniref:DUF368 domain-containing protein n=2 Tax=Alkalihalobacillus trypoxylicola TaxID=519424 RepID=A0A161PBP0_9BACI|nr:hypothetical protein AZF04_08975 [Alkalihalobacillus trypoxylicola]
MIIGFTEIVPGFSGGTMALLIGLYERLINSIHGITTKEWKKHVLFLINVGLGMGTAIVAGALGIKLLITHYTLPTFYMIMGLVLAIIPSLLQDVDYKSGFRGKHYLLLLVGGLIVASTAFIGEGQMEVIENITPQTYLLLFVSGWLASSALILPGISGTLVFLIFGVYVTILDAVSSFHFPVLIVVGLGVLVGLLITSKLVRYFFMHHRTTTYAVMIGCVAGSLFVIFPGIPVGLGQWLICMIMFLIGFILAGFLGRLKKS